MKLRIFHGLLIASIVVGAVLVWRTNATKLELIAEQQRLQDLTGELRIEDPSKVHIRAIETGEPFHFAWRVYVPAGHTLWFETEDTRSIATAGQDSVQCIVRLRIREDEDGGLTAYTHVWRGRKLATIAEPSVAEMVHGRWKEIEVQQLGTTDTAILDPTEKAVVLRLIMPPEMREEAASKLSPATLRRSVPNIFELEIVPPP